MNTSLMWLLILPIGILCYYGIYKAIRNLFK